MGEFPPNASEEDQNKLLDTTLAIQSDSGVIIPQGMILRLLEASRSGTADYESLHSAMNGMITRIILSQTATTEGTAGKLGNESSREKVKDEIVKADADLVCDSFNRTFVRWLTEWNFPNAKPPRVWRSMEAPEDLDSRAERESKLFQMGFKPTLKHVEDVYGGEWETADNAPIDNDQSAAAQPIETEDNDPTADGEFIEYAAIDDVADFAESDWQPLLSPLMQQIQGILDDSSDEEEFLKRLPELLKTADDGALIEDLAATMVQTRHAV